MIYPYECTFCGEEFDTEWELVEHYAECDDDLDDDWEEAEDAYAKWKEEQHGE